MTAIGIDLGTTYRCGSCGFRFAAPREDAVLPPPAAALLTAPFFSHRLQLRGRLAAR